MRKLIVLVVLLFTGSATWAQTTINGTVKDQNNTPIPYCSMGIKNSRTASIADQHGFYKLVIPDSLLEKEIIFSSVGYVEKSISVSKLRISGEVVLDEKVATLNQVVISGTKLKEKVIGQQKRPMLTFSKMFDKNMPSIEQGNIFELFSQTRLKSYNFFIIPSSKFKQITLRLNIYKVNGNLPSESLLQENILFSTSTTGWQRIDLTDYKLSYKNLDKIAITLQLVAHSALGDTAFVFGLSAKKSLSKNLLFRYQRQGNWETNEGTFISNLEVAYNQEGKNSTATLKEEQPEESADTQMLASIINHRQKAQQTIYGRNRSGKYIDVDSAKLYYEEYGKGEPLILLHGNGGSIADFYLQIPYLSKYFRVIALDTRGQGRSTDLSKLPYSYQQFASDLFQLTKVLKLARINILGWSDGGNTGLIFNYTYPQMVGKLVIIGSNLNPNGVKEQIIEGFNKQVEANASKGDLRLIKLMINQPNITPSELAMVTNPVLVIAGSDDVIKQDHTVSIGERIKNATVKFIPNSTHYLPFEQPDHLNKIVFDFMKKQ